MNTNHTTARATISVRGNAQLEPLPTYGWRCGFYSQRPAMERHATHPEFVAGVRSGRAQRQRDLLPQSVRLILSLPHLVAMRRAVQAEYGDAADRDRLIASAMRAANRNDGRISSAGRDAAGVWNEWRRLSAAYEAERARLIALRGVAA